MYFSIVTICFNSEKVIARTMESVLSQDVDFLEYVIIDGLSSDGTVEIAKQFRTQFENKGWLLHIVSEKDCGIYDAMNKGIRKSTGDFIGILNSGDWYDACALRTVEDYLSLNQVDYCFADMYLVKQDGTEKLKVSKKDSHPSSRHWNHPTMFVKKEVYERYGLYKCVGIHDDFDFYLRLRKNRLDYGIVNVPIAYFSVGGISNKKSLKQSIRRIKDRYRCYRDNGYSRFYIFECILMEAAKFFLV